MIRVDVTHPDLGPMTVDVDGEILELSGGAYIERVYRDGANVTADFPRRSDARNALIDALVADWRAKGGRSQQEKWNDAHPRRRSA